MLWKLCNEVSGGYKHLTLCIKGAFTTFIVSVIIPELLWMAPEILRKYPPRRATQMGDVYSFAIILYEICTRNEPYIAEEWYISLEGI